MRYAFIETEKANYPITVLCQVLQVSRSGYYAWRRWEPSARQQQDQVILEEIRESHQGSREVYGSPRITRDLRAAGRRISEKRVARLMRENRIVGKGKKRFRVTTQAGAQRAAENLLGRDFQAREPNRKWVTDISVPQQAA
jgi:putative transposase